MVVIVVTTDGEKVLNQSKSNAFLNQLVLSAIGHKKHTYQLSENCWISALIISQAEKNPSIPKWWLWCDVLRVAPPCVLLVKISLILQRLAALPPGLCSFRCAPPQLYFSSLSPALSIFSPHCDHSHSMPWLCWCVCACSRWRDDRKRSYQFQYSIFNANPDTAGQSACEEFSQCTQWPIPTSL